MTEDLKKIVEAEAERRFPANIGTGISRQRRFIEGADFMYSHLQGKIERLKEEINLLKEAAGELVHLHLCEQEGLSSGQPKPSQWLNAVEKLSDLLPSGLLN